MVYEKKCSNCGDIIDFGGKDRGRLPDDAIKFDDEIYCKDCVQEFVRFGIGNVVERIEQLEDTMEDVRDELGLEKH
ncbi:MAG: hypothetical protein H8Z69_00860 [Nanohaloarchaea archaeon]|nr:hypothetical protein [Candidatus Nanohaloarchaea archaeon]